MQSLGSNQQMLGESMRIAQAAARPTRPAGDLRGDGRFTTADRRRFFGIARGRVQECVPLIDVTARQVLLCFNVNGMPY
jgi:hypothetical protein